MSEHTEEPWKLEDDHDFANHNIVIDRQNSEYQIVANCHYKYNAQRIVQCVNALQGIENPVEFMKELKEEIASLVTAHEMYKDGGISDPQTYFEEVDSVINGLPFILFPTKPEATNRE